MTTYFYIASIIVALVGFFVMSYIHGKKIHKKKLICPMHTSCNRVLYSKHSHVFGISVEVLGMIFYAFIIICSSLYLLYNFPNLPEIIFYSSLAGLTFALYLESIQVFVIRKLCGWCMLSALVTVTIFFLMFLVR